MVWYFVTLFMVALYYPHLKVPWYVTGHCTGVDVVTLLHACCRAFVRKLTLFLLDSHHWLTVNLFIRISSLLVEAGLHAHATGGCCDVP